MALCEGRIHTAVVLQGGGALGAYEGALNDAVEGDEHLRHDPLRRTLAEMLDLDLTVEHVVASGSLPRGSP
jgi:hypothetical protein